MKTMVYTAAFAPRIDFVWIFLPWQLDNADFRPRANLKVVDRMVRKWEK